MESGASEGSGRAWRATRLDPPDPHVGDHPDRRVRRGQRDPRRGRAARRRPRTGLAAPPPMPRRRLAARTALDALLPSQQASDRRFLSSSLAQLGSGEHVERGIRFGERVADAVLAARANDGATRRHRCSPPAPDPGEYQLTAPAFAPAGFTQTAHVTPFVLHSASQFRARRRRRRSPAPSTRRTSTRSTRWAS